MVSVSESWSSDLTSEQFQCGLLWNRLSATLPTKPTIRTRQDRRTSRVTKQRLHQLIRKPQFPAPSAIYSPGPEWMSGDSGNDYSDGGDGRDHVHGEVGDDTLEGGPGADHVRGVTAGIRCYVDPTDEVTECEGEVER